MNFTHLKVSRARWYDGLAEDPGVVMGQVVTDLGEAVIESSLGLEPDLQIAILHREHVVPHLEYAAPRTLFEHRTRDPGIVV